MAIVLEITPVKINHNCYRYNYAEGPVDCTLVPFHIVNFLIKINRYKPVNGKKCYTENDVSYNEDWSKPVKSLISFRYNTILPSFSNCLSKREITTLDVASSSAIK